MFDTTLAADWVDDLRADTTHLLSLASEIDSLLITWGRQVEGDEIPFATDESDVIHLAGGQDRTDTIGEISARYAAEAWAFERRWRNAAGRFPASEPSTTRAGLIVTPSLVCYSNNLLLFIDPEDADLQIDKTENLVRGLHPVFASEPSSHDLLNYYDQFRDGMPKLASFLDHRVLSSNL